MAEAYDVLSGLNRMLESQERREQTKLQTSLAMMQFAQAKKMQDITVAGQQLTLLQAANTQMMGSQAQAFLSETGLDSYYLQTQQDDPANGAKKLVNKLKNKNIGFSAEEANRIASAIYASKAGSHGPILTIGQELYNDAIQAIADPTVKVDHMYTVFANTIGKDISFERLENINKTATNQQMILKEMMEMGKGDYEIQSDIGLVKEIPEDVTMSLDTLEAEDKGLPGAKSILTGTDLSEDIESYDNQIKDLADEIENRRARLRKNEEQVLIINAKRSSNIVINQSEEDYLNSSPQIKSITEAEIMNLNSQISDLKKEQSKFKRAEDIYSVQQLTDVVMQETTPLGF